MPGERAGGRAAERQSAAGGGGAVEPAGSAEEVDPEGGAAAVRAPEESMSASCVWPPAGPDSPAPAPRGSLLHQRLFLSSVKEDGWYHLRMGLFINLTEDRVDKLYMCINE